MVCINVKSEMCGVYLEYAQSANSDCKDSITVLCMNTEKLETTSS